jgi:type IV pilus assembly protein PilV
MKIITQRPHSPKPAVVTVRGFSLIELLVAVLVMGIGVLGVTALQMVSLQNNRAALERGEAVQLAYDMMDRIRANPEGTPAGAAYDGLDEGEDPPDPAVNCRSSDCSPAQMVAFDQAVWKCMLGSHTEDAVCQDLWNDGLIPDNVAGDGPQRGLSNGDGSIAVVGDVVTITVRWTDSAGDDQTVVIDSQV